MTPSYRSGSSAVMPVLFLAHGAPPLLDDAGWIAELAAWGKQLPRPRAILVVSAHWEQRPLAIGATRPLPLIYDFYGFPERFYTLRYPAPGAPELAQRIRELAAAARIRCVDEPERGLDHGTYIPPALHVPRGRHPGAADLRCPASRRPSCSRSVARSRRCAGRACC